MALTGLLSDVTTSKVAGLLEAREPAILEGQDPDEVGAFEDRVRGAGVDVMMLLGTAEIPDGPFRELALEAIALQTASEIEYAEYPEQQAPGDIGRGYHLHQLYLEKLAQLRAIVAANGGVPADGGAGGITTTSTLPRGRFPDASEYPDPVDRPRRSLRYLGIIDCP